MVCHASAGTGSQFESGSDAAQYNQALFRDFMPGYEGQVARVDGSHSKVGYFEVRNADGSGTVFYDTARFAVPRGDYQIMEDARGSQWYAIRDSGYEQALARVEKIIQDGGYDYDLSMDALINNAQSSAGYDAAYILAAYSASLQQQGTTTEDMTAKLTSVSHQMFPVSYEEKQHARGTQPQGRLSLPDNRWRYSFPFWQLGSADPLERC